MTDVATLGYALDEFNAVVRALDDSQMETMSNCEPWSVRRLASHTANNQLLWAGAVSGQTLVSVEDTMGAAPHDGPMAPFAADASLRALELWAADGVLNRVHATPFGELPGSVVILFPTVDAFVHAWDLSASAGQPIEFQPERIPAFAAVIEATCTDDVRALGLIQPATELPADATDTERLMAAAGRAIPR